MRHRVRQEVRREEGERVRRRGGDQVRGDPLHRVRHGHGAPAPQQDQARPQAVRGENLRAGLSDDELFKLIGHDY